MPVILPTVLVRMLILLLAAHALCDYPLQGDFLSKGKSRGTPVSGVPWWVCLSAHALIHAGAVLLITNSIGLSLAELVCHWIIDWQKGLERWSFTTDQALHVGCKLLWAALASLVVIV